MPNVKITFVQATFVLVTFVNIRNISAASDPIDETLKVASWEHLEQILTIKLTFFQATFVMVIFVHIRNISALTGPIFIKLFGPKLILSLKFF